jgi:hypothetical protein
MIGSVANATREFGNTSQIWQTMALIFLPVPDSFVKDYPADEK